MDDDEVIRSVRGRTTVVGWQHVRDLPPHSAFGCSWDAGEDVPADADRTGELVVRSEPVPVDRARPDDLERAEAEVVVLLAGAVDAACLQVLLRDAPSCVQDVAAADLQRWLVDATRRVTTASRLVCDLDCHLDVELRPQVRIAREPRGRLLDAGWCVADVSLMSRGPEGPRYAVVVRPHLVELTGYLEVSLVSTDLGTERLHGVARFCCSPRVSLHPGQLRIARIA